MAKEVVFKIKLEGGEQTIKTLDTIESEIVQIKNQLKDPSLSGDGFKTLNTNLDSAEKNLAKIGGSADNAKSGVDRLEGGTKILAGSISLAAGTIALFGEENEKTTQTLIKLQGALAIGQGIKDITEGFGKLGLSTKGVAEGFKQVGTAIKGNPILLIAGIIVSILAASGQLDDLIQQLGKTFGEIFEQIKPVLNILGDLIQVAIEPLLKIVAPLIEILGKALVPILNLTLLPFKILATTIEALTPFIEQLIVSLQPVIVIFEGLVAGIGGVLTSFSNWISTSEKTEKQQKIVEKSAEDLTKSYELLKKANENVNLSGQYELDLLKAKGASIDEINKKELQLSQNRKQQAIDNARFIVDEVNRQKLLLTQQSTGRQLNEAETKRLFELNAIQEQAFEDETKAIRANELLKEQIKTQSNERAKATTTKNQQTNLKNTQDAQKKELDLIKNRISDEEQALKNQSEAQLKQLRDNLTARGEFGVESENILAKAQRDSAKKLLEDQLTLLNDEKNKIQENTKITAEEKAKLLEELTQKEIDLRNQLSQTIRANSKTNAEEELKAVEESIVKAQEDLANKTKDNQIQITKETNDALNDLNERYRNGQIKDLETYEKEKEKIEEEANQKTLQSNLTTAQDNLKLANDEQTKLLATQKEGSKEYLDVQADTNAKIKDAEAQLSSAQLAISENTSNQLVQNSNDANDEILKNLEDQISAFQTLTNSIVSLTQPLSDNFNSLGLQISNTFASIASELPALFEKLKKPIDSSLEGADKAAAIGEKVALAFQFAAGAIGEIGTLLANQSQQRLENLQQETEETITNIEKQRDAQIQAIDDQVEKGVLSKEAGDAKKLALQQQFDKQLTDFQTAQNTKEQAIKKKAFEQEKAIRIATAVAQGAAAALNAFAAGNLVGGPITGGIFAGIAAAFAAIQIALIKNTQFPEGGSTTSTPPSTSVSVPGATNLGAAAPTNFQGDIFGTGQSQQGTAGFNNTQGNGGVVRAYVVESDISSTTNRLDRIRTSSEL
jgi:hypothetical protein